MLKQVQHDVERGIPDLIRDLQTNNIRQMTKKFGLIGYPIATSRSPMLFEKAFGGKYKYDLIEGEDFETSYQKFLDEYQAINVTAPFKQKAFAKVVALAREDKGLVSGPCFKIKASNLLLKGPEGIEAHNSDFTGIILSVAEAYFPGLTAECYRHFGSRGYIKVHQYFKQNIGEIFTEKPQALIVGCGGAGRAAAVAAAELGYDVALMNRTPEIAQALADEMPEYNFICVPMSDFKNSVRECELVIYTASRKIEDIDCLSIDDFAGDNHNLKSARKAQPEAAVNNPTPSKVILEANYKTPSFAGAILDKIEYAGALYIPGKIWHTFQGLTGYGIMTGEEPDLQALMQD